MALLELTNSDKKAIIDDEDYERVSLYKWFLNYPSPKAPFYFRVSCIIHIEYRLLHQFILQAKGIEHKDRNTLNNQKSNLIIVPHFINCHNRPSHYSSIKHSKFKGISWHKGMRQWQIHLCVNNKRYYLGCHSDEIEAALIYNQKAKELLGEHAKLNNV